MSSIVDDRADSAPVAAAVDDVERRIASAIARRREELGLSLAALAERCGVSKAMIAKVEAGQSAPTAGVLYRLCSGLGTTMSTLMAEVEQGSFVHVPAAEQPEWTDPETGLVRRVIVPRTGGSDAELARVTLPARTVVGCPVPPSPPIRQHVVVLSGRLQFTFGDRQLDLRRGDAVFAVIDRPTRFEAGPDGASYLLVQVVDA